MANAVEILQKPYEAGLSPAEEAGLNQISERIIRAIAIGMRELNRQTAASDVSHIQSPYTLATGREHWITGIDPTFTYAEKPGASPELPIMSDASAEHLARILTGLAEKSAALRGVIDACKRRGFEFTIVPNERYEEMTLADETYVIQEMQVVPCVGRTISDPIPVPVSSEHT